MNPQRPIRPLTPPTRAPSCDGIPLDPCTGGPSPAHRRRLIRATQRWLGRRADLRLHMMLLVALTGLCGFLFSLLMLKAGLTSMAARYPIAVVLAYGVFLGLLRVWLHLNTPVPPAVGGSQEKTRDDPSPVADELVLDAAQCGLDSLFSDGMTGSAPGDSTDVLDACDTEEAVFFLIALAALLAGVVACLYVVWTAPVLMAEIFVDGVIMSRMYRNLRHQEASGWISSALDRTWIPALLVVIFFGVAGVAMHAAVPHAHSIGAFVRHFIT